MKQNLKIFTLFVCAVLVGSTFGSVAKSEVSSPAVKIAVVDVPAVVESSAEVRKLKDSQKAKIDELTEFVKTAKADVDSTKDPAQKQKLEDSYNKELNDRKKVIDKNYLASLASIEKNISGVISKKAKTENYQLVLAKGIVLYGGVDITDSVKKLVK